MCPDRPPEPEASLTTVGNPRKPGSEGDGPGQHGLPAPRKDEDSPALPAAVVLSLGCPQESGWLCPTRASGWHGTVAARVTTSATGRPGKPPWDPLSACSAPSCRGGGRVSVVTAVSPPHPWHQLTEEQESRAEGASHPAPLSQAPGCRSHGSPGSSRRTQRPAARRPFTWLAGAPPARHTCGQGALQAQEKAEEGQLARLGNHAETWGHAVCGHSRSGGGGQSPDL